MTMKQKQLNQLADLKFDDDDTDDFMLDESDQSMNMVKDRAVSQVLTKQEKKTVQNRTPINRDKAKAKPTVTTTASADPQKDPASNDADGELMSSAVDSESIAGLKDDELIGDV